MLLSTFVIIVINEIQSCSQNVDEMRDDSAVNYLRYRHFSIFQKSNVKTRGH